MKRRAALLIAAWGHAASQAAGADAAPWPRRAIRIVVPAPAGGPYDQVIRPIAAHMALRLGQPVWVENRPGAGSIPGALAVATAAPDGYTIGLTGMLNVVAASIYPNLPFDIEQDFAPIGQIGGGAQWLVAGPVSGIHSIDELLAKAAANPDGIDCATSGVGSAGHLLMELLRRESGAALRHIPYQGGAPALKDLLAGAVPLMLAPPNIFGPHLREGRLRVLATSLATRSATQPGIPTFAERGYPGLTMTSWMGLSAPARTPEPVIQRLNHALRSALADPQVARQLEAQGLVIATMSPAQYGQWIRAETARWRSVVQTLALR